QGKIIQQGDKTTYLGMSKEVRDFRDNTGEEALWTNSMFGGMPAYLISVKYSSNLIQKINKCLNIGIHPANFLFICLLGFYIALLIFKVDPWLSIIGAIAFAFSSYFFIIIAAGHNSKAIAIAYMAPIIAGVYLAYKRKILLGSAVAGLFLALQLTANHLQITYYTLIIILIYGIYELRYTIKNKTYNKFLKTSGILLIAVILAVGSNFSRIWTTYEYGKYSIRGESELTHDADNKTSGLDKDYATAWSYGIDETLTLLIPNFKGGASGGELSTKSATYNFFKQMQGARYAKQVIKHVPLYWGSQPFTSGPVYVGAIIIFLFVLGIFIVDRKIKWWLITATILSIMLAWGHNLNWFTNFFLEYVPGYNKFRTVSMTLVIAQFTIPLLGLLALKNVFSNDIDKDKLKKAIKKSLYITGGISLFFAIFPGMFFNFTAESDQTYIAQGAQAFIDALREDRQSILQADAIRSFVFIALSFVVLYAFLSKKLSRNMAMLALFALIITDMWSINKRYLNNDNFVSKREAKTPFKKTQANKMILQDTDPNFRVMNVAVSTFNDASTSYFHKSIGGYHGAKMKRYQEVVNHHISKNNMDVLNMLNTKYFIVPDKNRKGPAQVQRNPNPLGNSWFVKKYKLVDDADAEIAALNNFNPKTEAIIDKRFDKILNKKSFTFDSTANITLAKYKPNNLIYNSSSKTEQLAVFSEIYYPKGWEAYIDGKAAKYVRANYILRAMIIPKGEHKIEWKFKPKSYFIGNKVSLATSSLLLLLFFGVVAYEIKLYLKKDETV
ncbi:MAG: YfhO family protein, partial [Bacteroidota bacterium]|nr:YfhO family protein [Bacteroidota bacterium]